MAKASGNFYIPCLQNGKDGADAVFYEIVPGTYAVSLDADGNWVEGTDISVIDGVECARVFYTLTKHIGSSITAPDFYTSLVYGNDKFDVGRYSGYVYIKPTDTAINLMLYKLDKDNPPLYTGEYLGARCTITVNRAGSNGTSAKIQFSKDGASWHDTYQSGDIYMRVYNGTSWSDAIKFVGSNGTSFTPKGKALGHYDTCAKFEEEMSSLSPGCYLCDQNWKNEAVPTTIRRYGATRAYSVAAVGDAYRIGTNLWVNNGSTWVDFGEIQGADGTSVYIKETKVTYGISASPKDPTTVKTWSESVQTVTSSMPYLWTKTYVLYSDGTETTSYSVATRGNRGAVFRQHDGFVDGDYNYQSGSGTEEFIDVVRSDSGVWYRCIKSYNSTSVPTANSLSNTTYWSTNGMSNMQFIATELLLAQNATINMMGTNEINLYDGDARFGSFRVPHGDAGVDGDADSGKYALWLGGKTADEAPFSVTKGGAVKATSGEIGQFNIYSYQDNTGFKTYYLSSSTSGSAILPPCSVRLDYEGIEVRAGQASNLACVAQIGHSGSKVDDEFCWGNGFVSVSAYFSGSELDTTQTSFRAEMTGNGKNTMVGFEANVSGGKNNYAFHAENGDIVAEDGSIRGHGFCGGTGLSVLRLSSTKQYYNSSELDISKNSTWLVFASENKYNTLVLPKLSVAKKLAGGATSFCLRLTVIAKTDSKQFYLAGRNTSNTYLSSNEYPTYRNNDGGNGYGVNMASGDILELALIYDGSDYSAYCLNYRN